MTVRKMAEPQSVRRGLSLIDMTITILVIGILTVAGQLRYADALAVYRINAVAERFKATLENAKHVARSRNVKVTVSFDKRQNRCTINGMPNPNHPKSMKYDILLSEYSPTLAIVDVSPPSFEFNNLGMIKDGGTITISDGSTTKVISVADETGGVSVL